jgi:prephenate dehydrogenase
VNGAARSLEGVGTVAVVGLGLMGGSLARDLAARGYRVVAADPDAAVLADARAHGVISGTFPLGADRSSDRRAERGLDEADLVIVATPVRAALPILRWLAGAAPPHAVLTDVGSTKRSITEAAGAAGLSTRFVGGHPMAGDHRSGWAAAREGLFIGSRVWLCAGDEGAADAEALVAAMWAEVGALPLPIDAVDHDEMIAWSSHLPQLLASALGCALDGEGVDRSALGPGGRDTTRLAGSDPALWTDILMDNADALEPALDALLEELVRLRRHIGGLDDASLRATLEAARRWSEGVRDPAPAGSR